jgi:hypothetical protein
MAGVLPIKLALVVGGVVLVGCGLTLALSRKKQAPQQP